jgi:hypothetical protein
MPITAKKGRQNGGDPNVPKGSNSSKSSKNSKNSKSSKTWWIEAGFNALNEHRPCSAMDDCLLDVFV